MLKCSKCERVFQSFSELSPHLIYFHQCLKSDKFLCGQPLSLCARQTFSFSALKVHYENRHINQRLENENADNFELGENVDDANFEFDVGPGNAEVFVNAEELNAGANHENHNYRFTLENFINTLYSNVQIYAAQLYSMPNSSRKMVDLILSATTCLFSGSIALLKDIVLNVISKFEVLYDGFADDARKLEEIFEVLMNPLESMETEYHRLKMFSERGVFIAPQSFHIGSVDKYTRGRDRIVTLVDSPVSGYVIPLRKVLKVFLELPGMFEIIMEYIQTLETAPPGLVTHAMQGNLWRNLKESFGDKIVLPLEICFDDYEPDNTLGSHKGDHALGALYAQLSCLPGYLASSLDNMFSFAMFETKYRKLFGNNVSFRLVIEELKYLYDHGITITVNNQDVHVYFCLLVIIGDNAGLNEILGFVGSFRANFYCRICKMHRDEISHWCSRVPNGSLRTVDNYEIDVGEQDASVTGIVQQCVFNEVPNYHCIINQSCDVLHDIYEGMLKYDLCNLLYYFIVRREYFSLDTLRERVSGFDYGPSDIGNKPPADHFTIEKLRDCSLNLSASEWLCLGRYLGLMIGDLIPDMAFDFFAPNAWKLYLILHEILLIIVSPVVKTGIQDYLQVLIQEHHEIYVQFFGPLKPKHHFMLHYPKLLELYGPLIPISTLKSERNHRRGKIYAHSCNSRVDFAYSSIVKYQLILCERLLRVDDKPLLTYNKVTRVRTQSLSNYELFVDLLPNQFDFVESVNSATVSGTLYSVQMILVLNVEQLLPVFGRILHIVLHNGTAAFIIRKLNTLAHRNHVRAYLVEDTNEFVFLQPSDMLFHIPLWQRISSDDGKTVVCLKHFL